MSPCAGRVAALAIGATVALAAVLVAPVAGATPVVRVSSAEQYALELLNCTRTGGRVTADGRCLEDSSGTYSAYRDPLPRHAGISGTVAWPWARALVRHRVCGHVIAGKPELPRRLASRGYDDAVFGENVGCGWGQGTPEEVILAAHRSMQAEKRTRGPHWRNMKDPRFKSVGIGVATGGGYTMVVYDFYGRRY